MLPLVCALLLAQQPSSSPPVKQAAPIKTEAPVRVRLTLNDGSVVQGTPVTDVLHVNTPCGELTCTFRQLHTLDLGPRLSAAEEQTFKAALAQLGSDDHAEREMGNKALLGLGPCVYPFLLQSSTKDIEVAKRLVLLARALENKHTDLRKPAPDRFATGELSGSGTVRERQVRLRTLHLGELTVDLAHVRTVVILNQMVHTLTLDGYAVANMPLRWQSVNVDVLAGVRLVLTAEGTMDIYPQQPGQYLAQPDGYRDANNSLWRGITPDDRGLAFNGGTLLYRIGDGPPKVAGTRCVLTGSGGTLRLAVVPSPWNTAVNGQYKVTIRPE